MEFSEGLTPKVPPIPDPQAFCTSNCQQSAPVARHLCFTKDGQGTNEGRDNAPTKWIGTCYHPGDRSILKRGCTQTPAGTHRQELFPRHDGRLEDLGRLLPKENCFIQFRRPRQLHILVLCIDSNCASPAAAMVDSEGVHRARVSGRRGDTPRLWRKGSDCVPPTGSPLPIWGRSIRLDSQKVKRDRLFPCTRSVRLKSRRTDGPTRLYTWNLMFGPVPTMVVITTVE